MQECKILRFVNSLDAKRDSEDRDYLPNANCEHQIKTFGNYWTNSDRAYRNSSMCDYPQWEQEINKYLKNGWTIQSISSGAARNFCCDFEITVVLVR